MGWVCVCVAAVCLLSNTALVGLLAVEYILERSNVGTRRQSVQSHSITIDCIQC